MCLRRLGHNHRPSVLMLKSMTRRTIHNGNTSANSAWIVQSIIARSSLDCDSPSKATIPRSHTKTLTTATTNAISNVNLSAQTNRNFLNMVLLPSSATTKYGVNLQECFFLVFRRAMSRKTILALTSAVQDRQVRRRPVVLPRTPKAVARPRCLGRLQRPSNAPD